MQEWQRRLRDAAVESGEKKYLVARDAGVAPETLSRLLNEPNQRPGLEIMCRIAHALGVTVGWLVGQDEYRLKPADQDRLRDAARLILDTFGARR